MAVTIMGQIANWVFKSAPVSLAANSAPQVIIAAAGAGKRIRLVGLFGGTDVAEAVTLYQGATPVSGAVQTAAYGRWLLAPIPAESVPYYGWFDTPANVAVSLLSVLGAFGGIVLWAEEQIS